MKKEIAHNDLNDGVHQLVNQISSSPEDFEHLKVFLHRERNIEFSQDYEFLMVSPEAFGKVKLLDINVKDHCVILSIFDCITKQVGNVSIDIDNSNPNTFFIQWNDVRQMVLDETSIGVNHNGLLEFDF